MEKVFMFLHDSFDTSERQKVESPTSKKKVVW